MGYDPDCEDLAKLFIDDPPLHSQLLKVGYSLEEIDSLRPRLAQYIQDAVESWFVLLDDEIEEKKRAGVRRA